ncbi:MAG: hypothetical protein WC728_02000 [Elusimicrobiota bacterium]
MKKVVIVLVSVFLFADGLALLVWWTHPQGARKMGFSGKLPLGLEVMLPYRKAAPAPSPASAASAGASAFPLDARGVPEVPEATAAERPSGSGPQTPGGDALGGPGGCRGSLECRNYCSAPSHWAECLAFCSKHPDRCQSEESPAATAVRSMEEAQGPRSDIPISGVRRPGRGDAKAHDPAALGGCRDMEECSEFCSKEENRQVCDAYCAKPENQQRCGKSKQILQERGVMPGPEGGQGEGGK